MGGPKTVMRPANKPFVEIYLQCAAVEVFRQVGSLHAENAKTRQCKIFNMAEIGLISYWPLLRIL